MKKINFITLTILLTNSVSAGLEARGSYRERVADTDCTILETMKACYQTISDMNNTDSRKFVHSEDTKYTVLCQYGPSAGDGIMTEIIPKILSNSLKTDLAKLAEEMQDQNSPYEGLVQIYDKFCAE